MSHTFVLHGVRGSVPVDGPEFARHGGATTCYSLDLGDSTLLVVDAGTGIRSLTPSCLGRPVTVHLLMTHYHHDHLNGLPFFAPMLARGSRLVVYGRPCEDGMPVEQAVRKFMRPPWFPVSFSDITADVEFVDLDDQPITVAGVAVSSARLNHPQGVTGFRFDLNGRSLAIATDHERGDDTGDTALRRLAAGADVLLHDAQYLPDEYPDHLGWGHSTWQHAVAAALEVGADRLILVSHDPHRTDDAIERICDQAREALPETTAGRTGMTVDLSACRSDSPPRRVAVPPPPG
jgi:phosphoribosyl 1,2-cyclic phosphodiesterase